MKLINRIFEIQQTSIKILLNLGRDIKYQIFLSLITELYWPFLHFRATSVTGSAVNELHQRGSHNMCSVIQLKAMKCCFLCCMLLSFIWDTRHVSYYKCLVFFTYAYIFWHSVRSPHPESVNGFKEDSELTIQLHQTLADMEAGLAGERQDITKPQCSYLQK